MSTTGNMTATSRKRTRKEPAQRRAEIVEAAIALAGETGLDRLTGRDIAARVGVTSGLLHHYFPHIDDVIVEAFRQVVAADLAAFADGADDLPPLDALRGFLRHSLSVPREAVLSMWMSAWVAAPRRPKLALEVERQMHAGVDLLARLIDKGRQTGEFTSGDSERSAWRILVTLDGIAVQRTIKPAALSHEELFSVVSQVAERELGLPEGTVRSAEAGGVGL